MKTDAAFLAALCLVVIGVGCIYWPAAFIVAGGLIALLTVAYDKGSDE